MTPSDVSFHDVERGKVDMVINRFDSLPQSFHQVHLWDDSFSCVMSANNPVKDNWSLRELSVEQACLGEQNRHGGRRGHDPG